MGGAASLWLGPATPLSAVLATYLLFSIFLGTVNPPITNTALHAGRCDEPQSSAV